MDSPVFVNYEWNLALIDSAAMFSQSAAVVGYCFLDLPPLVLRFELVDDREGLREVNP